MGDNFPERLKKLAIYPFPWYGRAIWAVVRVFVEKRTQDKVFLIPHSGKGLPKDITDLVDPNNIPVSCGGFDKSVITNPVTTLAPEMSTPIKSMVSMNSNVSTNGSVVLMNDSVVSNGLIVTNNGFHDTTRSTEQRSVVSDTTIPITSTSTTTTSTVSDSMVSNSMTLNSPVKSNTNSPVISDIKTDLATNNPISVVSYV